MSRIASISTATRPLSHRAYERPVKPAATNGANLPMVIHRADQRRHHKIAAAAPAAAYSTHVLAGPRRRGLKADPAEQSRIFASYVRVQDALARTPQKIKILA